MKTTYRVRMTQGALIGLLSVALGFTGVILVRLLPEYSNALSAKLLQPAGADVLSDQLAVSESIIESTQAEPTTVPATTVIGRALEQPATPQGLRTVELLQGAAALRVPAEWTIEQLPGGLLTVHVEESKLQILESQGGSSKLERVLLDLTHAQQTRAYIGTENGRRANGEQVIAVGFQAGEHMVIAAINEPTSKSLAAFESMIASFAWR
ncbi:MAG: hypothetical protein Q8P33_03770 [bacterium]|nr:hypothetical protein [bacterium]